MIDLNLCLNIFLEGFYLFHLLSFIILSCLVFHLEEGEKRDWLDILFAESTLVFCASGFMMMYIADVIIDWDKKHSNDIVKKNKHE